MSIFLLILKIIGYLLLGLLGILVAALFVPVTAKISYVSGRLAVKIKVLFLEFSVYDSEAPKKAKEEKQQQTAAEAEQKEPQKGKKPKLKIDSGMIQVLIGAGTKATAHILKHIKLRHIEIRTVVEGYDPYEIGKKTGRYWEAVGGILPILRFAFQYVQVDVLEIIPDFLDELKNTEYYKGNITAKLATFVAAGMVVLARLIKYKIKQMKIQKQTEKEIENERKSA